MEDFINDLKVKGCKSASLWGIQPKQVSYLIDIGSSVLGREFFANTRSRMNHLLREQEPLHPLLRLLKKGDFFEPGISELMEIGLYCEAFVRDPNLNYCLNQLRQETMYESTLFQLGMAYRIKMMGYEVQLEPTTIRGKADIEFSYLEKKYVAECYRINKTLLDYQSLGETIFKTRLLSLMDRQQATYSVKLVFKENIEERKANALFEVVRTQIARSAQSGKKSFRIEANSLYVEVEDISGSSQDPDFSYNLADRRIEFLRNKNFDEILTANWVKKEEIFKVKGERIIPKDKTRVFVHRLSDEEKVKSAIDVLASKINAKIGQTKVLDPNVGRVLFVLFPYGLFVTDTYTHNEIRLKAVTQFGDLSGILLFDRQVDGKNRFRYDGVTLSGSVEKSLPKTFFMALKAFERTNLFANAPTV